MKLKTANSATKVLIILAQLFLLVVLPVSIVNASCEDTESGCAVIGRDIQGNWYCDSPTCFAVNYAACGSNVVGGTCCYGPERINLCTGSPTSTPTPGPSTPTPAPFEPYSPPTNETFDAVNPLNIAGGDNIDATVPSQFKDELSTPGGIISRALTFIFPLAGLLLFALLVWGGFEMLIGSPTKKSMESGKNRVTAAIAGFFLLFAAYWIWQIVEVIFGVAIL